MKISYGLSALGSPVHIGSLGLERGLACGCTCPSCGTALVARQGDERVHHFAHHGQTAELCSYAAETELHIRAKALIEQRKQVNIPLHVASSDYVVYQLYPVTNVRLEQFHTGKKPDLIVTINGFDYLIEIAVTHFTDADKQKVYRDNLLNAIEVDLSGYKNVDDAELERVLEDALFASQSPAYAYWISLSPISPLLTDVKKLLREETTKAVATYNNTVAVTRQLESDLELLTKNYKQLATHHSALQRQYTELLTLGDLDSQIHAKRQEVMTLTDRQSKLNAQQSVLDKKLLAVSKDAQTIREEQKRQLNISNTLNKQEQELNQRSVEIASREAHILKTEDNLRTHSLSLDDIESILAEKKKLSAFHFELKSHGLCLSDVQGLSDYLKQLGNMDQLLADRLEVIESQLKIHNEKLQRLQGDIRELVGQKNYYLQEVAKLHRDLKQATQSS